MNVDALKDAVRAAVEKIVPGSLAILLGAMLALLLGVTWLLEGPPLLRTLTGGLAQPLRSLALFTGLALPLVILGYAFRKGVGYIVSLTTRTRRGRR